MTLPGLQRAVGSLLTTAVLTAPTTATPAPPATPAPTTTTASSTPAPAAAPAAAAITTTTAPTTAAPTTTAPTTTTPTTTTPTTTTPTGAAAAAAAPEPAWGLLDSTCDPQRASANRSAGMSVVVLELAWDRYQPSPGVSDGAYVTSVRDRIATCFNAGLRIILGSGMQYPPPWVRQLNGATLLDQRGRAPRTGQVDGIFSAAVRNAQADYLRRLAAELPLDVVEAVRVGTTPYGEIGFPGGADNGVGPIDSWWAFNTAAQTGQGLAPGLSPTPMRGWVPGQRTWNGRAVTAADARNWFTWYSRVMASSLVFQAGTLRGAGYTGAVHLPAAGRGVLPADLTAATNALLDGTANRDDSLARGLNYVDQFPLLAQNIPNLVIDLTSVDDASSVEARALNPRQDMCTLSDPGTSVDPAAPVATWSRFRFARAQVARAGLPAVGENPGPPGMQTGGTPNSDSEAEQIRRSPAYARTCGLASFLLAFEVDLYSGRSGVTMQNYVDAISAPPGAS